MDRKLLLLTATQGDNNLPGRRLPSAPFNFNLILNKEKMSIIVIVYCGHILRCLDYRGVLISEPLVLYTKATFGTIQNGVLIIEVSLFQCNGN